MLTLIHIFDYMDYFLSGFAMLIYCKAEKHSDFGLSPLASFAYTTVILTYDASAACTYMCIARS